MMEKLERRENTRIREINMNKDVIATLMHVHVVFEDFLLHSMRTNVLVKNILNSKKRLFDEAKKSFFSISGPLVSFLFALV